MTTRKRRPPKRQAGRVSRLIAGGAAMIGAAAMRNPVATGGTAAFAIIFLVRGRQCALVSAKLASASLARHARRLRDYAAKAMHPGGDATTTYRIERDATVPAGAPAEAAPQPVAQKPVDGVVVHDDPQPSADNIVGQIQANLARRGLYEGPVDGVMGSKTEAAIMFYQETRGLQQTGAADAAVLDLLKRTMPSSTSSRPTGPMT